MSATVSHLVPPKTRCGVCKKPWTSHANGVGSDGHAFERNTALMSRVGNSFSASEIELLDAIRRGLVYRNLDLSHLARHKSFATLAQKIQDMAARITPTKKAVSK